MEERRQRERAAPDALDAVFYALGHLSVARRIEQPREAAYIATAVLERLEVAFLEARMAALIDDFLGALDRADAVILWISSKGDSMAAELSERSRKLRLAWFAYEFGRA